MRLEVKVEGGYVRIFPLEAWARRLKDGIALEVPVFFNGDDGRTEAGTVWLGAEPLFVAEHEAKQWAKRFTRTSARTARDD